MPHSLLGGGWGVGSSPATSPSWAAVWDLFHFPLVAPLVPPRYTLPNSSLDSCLAQTSNIVQASLAVPPLKNLHLRHSQMAAASSWVGPYCGSHARDTAWGSRTFSSHDNLSSAVIFGGGILHQTQIMLWDIDLNHQSSSCLHDHVKGLKVADLGQG